MSTEEERRNKIRNRWFVAGILAIGSGNVIKGAINSHHKNEILNGPAFGGVTITSVEGNEIPPEKLKTSDIKDFLILSLEEARKHNHNPVLQEGLTTRSHAFFDRELSGEPPKEVLSKNIYSAIKLIQKNDFAGALGDVEDALVYVPKAKIDAAHPEFAADTVAVQKAAEQVAPPLEKARKVLEWLVLTEGKRINKSGDQGRGQQ